jgi:hypothetical protein
MAAANKKALRFDDFSIRKGSRRAAIPNRRDYAGNASVLRGTW